MTPLVTASGLERVMQCVGPVVLPGRATNDSVWRATGNHVDAFIRRVLGGMSVWQALEFVPSELRPRCAAIDFVTLTARITDIRTQGAYVFDVKTRKARLLGYNLQRSYNADSTDEIAGTNDFEGRDPLTGRPVTCDVKSGQAVTACESNPQALFQMLSKVTVDGADDGEGRILYVRDDGSVFVDWHQFTRFDIDVFADAIEQAMDAVYTAQDVYARTGTVSVHKGEWCRYCPALHACPAHVGLARSMVVDLDALKERVDALTPEQAGQAWLLAKQAESLVEAVLDGLKGYARQEPLPLGDGRRVEEVACTREDFSRPAALKLLRSKGASPEEISELWQPHEVKQVKAVGKRSKKALKGATT